MTTTTVGSNLDRSTPLGRRILWLVRRIHLYLGVALFPLVTIYAVSGFLFNHPALFPVEETFEYVQDGSPAQQPLVVSPSAIAQRVVETLSQQQPGRFGNGRLKLSSSSSPTFIRKLFVSGSGPGNEYSTLIDLHDGGGLAIVRHPKGPVVQEPFGSPQPCALDVLDKDAVAAAVRTVLEQRQYLVSELKVHSPPEVQFTVELDGVTQPLRYSPAAAQVTAVVPKTYRERLLSLHAAHTYTASWNGRFFWALMIDVLCGTLVFWGLSGLLMTWQLRAVRRSSLPVMIVGVVFTAVLVWKVLSELLY